MILSVRRLLLALSLLLPPLALVATVAVRAADGNPARQTLVIVTKAGRQVFHVEVAADEAARERGLMQRTSLPADGGMLFEFGPAAVDVAMWMKNTFIPLDMLFIRGDGTIACITQRTVPQSLTPIACDQPVRAVLEINGGMSARLGIATGDKVLHALFGNKP